jgi:hypothetical protein
MLRKLFAAFRLPLGSIYVTLSRRHFKFGLVGWDTAKKISISIDVKYQLRKCISSLMELEQHVLSFDHA